MTDFDAEFERLTADLTTPENRCIGLVLSPLSNTGALEGLLHLAGVNAQVVMLKPWAAVWMEVPWEQSEEDEMAAFLTGERQPPEAVDKVARVISGLSNYGAVVLVSWLNDNTGIEPGVSGQITAKRYLAGEPEEDIPAGLVLNSIDGRAEDLLLGHATPEDDEGRRGGWRRFFKPGKSE